MGAPLEHPREEIAAPPEAPSAFNVRVTIPSPPLDPPEVLPPPVLEEGGVFPPASEALPPEDGPLRAGLDEEPRPRPPLFARPAQIGGHRRPLNRLVSLVVGDAIPRGLRQRVEVRLVTVGLYAAVALGAMLLVALFVNLTQSERQRDLDRVLETEFPPRSARGEVVPGENVPPGPGVPPEVREVVRGTVAPSNGSGAVGLPVPGNGAKDEALGGDRVWRGEKGPPGHYVQIQSMVFPEHAEKIVAHLKTLGYRSIWLQPMVVRGNLKRVLNSFIIRLGPYPTTEVAEEEKASFKALIKATPLRSPRLDWTSPYVLEIKQKP